MPKPSSYTPEIAQAVCDRLEAGESLRAIARDESMPSKGLFLGWVESMPDVADQYTRARARGWDEQAERAVERAQAAEDAAKGRLAFDADRWYLGKMAPKKYGDRQVLAGDPEAPLQGLSEAQVKARLAELLAKRAT
jgi:hypothetical protein